MGGGGGGSSTSASTTTNRNHTVTKNISDSYNKTINRVNNIQKTGKTVVKVSGGKASKVPEILDKIKNPSANSTAPAADASGSLWDNKGLLYAGLAVGVLIIFYLWRK
ncbi:MAG: hypothetical protein HY299_09855 [Verrucomicrobia bacterium]|nr:hypothetical protein [Verrucomicrobiota bacterium]